MSIASLAKASGNPAEHENMFPGWVLLLIITGLTAAILALFFLPYGNLIDRLTLIDAGICAQLPSHSLYPGGIKLPLCARNTGIYLGFAVTSLYMLAMRKGKVNRFPSLKISILMVAAVAALGIDGFNSFLNDLGWFHLYQPQNILRLITGLAAGMAVASLLIPASGLVIWKVSKEVRSVNDWHEMIAIIALLVLAFIAVYSQVPFMLYPVAILSSFGLISAISTVNFTLLASFTGKQETAEKWGQWGQLFAAGVLLALIEMVLLALIRVYLFHNLAIGVY